MIKTEIIDEKYVKTYSDKGFIIHGGSPIGDYVEAIDPVGTERIYTETDIPIEEEPTEEEYAEAGRILLGDTNEDD